MDRSCERVSPLTEVDIGRQGDEAKVDTVRPQTNRHQSRSRPSPWAEPPSSATPRPPPMRWTSPCCRPRPEQRPLQAAAQPVPPTTNPTLDPGRVRRAESRSGQAVASSSCVVYLTSSTPPTTHLHQPRRPWQKWPPAGCAALGQRRLKAIYL